MPANTPRPAPPPTDLEDLLEEELLEATDPDDEEGDDDEDDEDLDDDVEDRDLDDDLEDNPEGGGDICPECDELVDLCVCSEDPEWDPDPAPAPTPTPPPAPAFPEPVDLGWRCFAPGFQPRCSCGAENCRRCGQCSDSTPCECGDSGPLLLDPPRPTAPGQGPGPTGQAFLRALDAAQRWAASSTFTRPTPPEYPGEPVTADGRPPVPRLALHDRREEESCRIDWANPGLYFYPPDPAERASPKDPKLPRRYVSVEIEVGGLLDRTQARRVREACDRWNCAVVYDGSIPITGFEINTSPARGKYFIDQVTDLTGALRKAKAWVNWRCGMHVHVDSRDLTDAQILRLIEVYARVEDGLFQVVPDTRRRNGEYRRRAGEGRVRDYCEKCARKLLAAVQTYLHKPDQSLYWGVPPDDTRKKNKYRTRRLVRQAVYHGLGQADIRGEGFGADGAPSQAARDRATGYQLSRLTLNRYSKARYYALNLHSHFYRSDGGEGRRDDVSRLTFPTTRGRGTIECRLAAGTTDPAKILPWAFLWDGLVGVATGWPTRDIEALPKDPFEALLGVAPTEDVRKWLVARKDKFSGVSPAPEEDW